MRDQMVYVVVRDLESHDGPEVDVFDNIDHAQEIAKLTGGIFQEQAIMSETDPETEKFLDAVREGVYS